jgi:dihydrofolate synthase/folylpolyglutamate synthase
MDYAKALAFLYPRTTTIKFGLDTTRALLDELGSPDRVFPSIHIGGTNGKGSVSNLVAAALAAAGWRVGLYTSPHLCSFRERIVVAGVPVSEAAVAMWTSRLEPEVRRLGATFFEATTAMALADFAARGVEIAVLEVGLGGRLDSTNVVTPLVSCVTNVSLDHQKYLGDTVEDIAREKAGIAKVDVPFVLGEQDPRRAIILAEEARLAIGREVPGGICDVVQVPAAASWEGPLGLVGKHQKRNAAVAAAVLDQLPAPYRPTRAEVTQGFDTATAPGRLDRRGRWLFDVAHNPDGMAALVEALATDPPEAPVNALVSILGDKPWAEMLVSLDRVIDRGILTLAPTAAERGWDTAWLSEWMARADRPPARAEWHLVADFEQALHEVQAGAGTILVTGSFHTVGDVMRRLGLEPV